MVGSVLLLAVMAAAVRKNPVTDTMEGIGNTAGTVQDGAGSATSAVGGDQLQSGAGSVITGAGDAMGSGASTVGGAVPVPEQVGVLGGGGINAVSTALKCVINLTCQYL